MKAGSFSRALGVSETTVRNYLDRNSKPSSDILEKISNTFNQVNLTWLITGKGEPLLQSTSTTANTANIKNNSGIGINNGSATITLEACQRELENMRRDAASYQREIELLKGQLEAKDHLIASKDELLNFLRGGFNRPN